ELMKIAKKKHIAVIFIQPQANRRTADIIAKQIGAKVKILDPLAPQWLKNMHRVMDVFVETLSQN
ncbi:MAG: zinc ABC transporter substrate-binding protein, partial [Gammaproteobacteria bacterium]